MTTRAPPMFVLTNTFSKSKKTKYFTISDTEIKFRTKKAANRILAVLNNFQDVCINLVKSAARRVYQLVIDDVNIGDCTKRSFTALQNLITQLQTQKETTNNENQEYQFHQTRRCSFSRFSRGQIGFQYETVYVQYPRKQQSNGNTPGNQHQKRTARYLLLPGTGTTVPSENQPEESCGSFQSVSAFLNRLEQVDRELAEREASGCELNAGVASLTRGVIREKLRERKIRIDCELIKYGIENLRADQERIRADQERIRADQLDLKADIEEFGRAVENYRADQERIRADQLDLEAEIDEFDRCIQDALNTALPV